ncbi:MAG: DUF2238 domain-containing protein [Bacteroidetes bacterium]|nr:DUF2238 domain-containing protein [Flavobacteriales bacterium]NOG94246.1 DUF2238 domain-containing protein [Bacteroidota bacterium]WKZ76564.1 MAG: DUF2238 domain-containing protein [Vicingaceae bacterium]CAG0956186.1 Inner membrane protein YjdF [Flavobacteriales bacterium]
MRNYPKYLFSVYLLIWGILAINPSYRFDWFLENILVFVFGILLVVTHRKYPLSNKSYTLIFLFSVFHIIGAHYTYSEVPFASKLSELVGVERNYYDRFIHFTFGLLITLPMGNLLELLSKISGRWLYLLTIAIMISFGEIYELLEWLTAIIVSPKAGIAFLGAQGDVFDAQKDVFCNLAGIFIALLVYFFTKKRSLL